ncbi:MAG: SAM-dependent methyltransferase [Candidatus Thorarchaeota archaeon]|jgi:predicted RNA methylase
MEPWIVLLIVEICILIFGIWIVWSAVVGAPWLPTPKKRVRAMLEIADVTADDVVYDLGSGDGRIIVMAAKDYGATSVGIEIDPLRYHWSKLNIRRHRLRSKVKVLRTNFFKTDLSDATVVTLYQGHDINKKIRDKLAENLKSGTRVVSYRFILTGWEPVKTDEESSTFLYVV